MAFCANLDRVVMRTAAPWSRKARRAIFRLSPDPPSISSVTHIASLSTRARPDDRGILPPRTRSATIRPCDRAGGKANPRKAADEEASNFRHLAQNGSQSAVPFTIAARCAAASAKQRRHDRRGKAQVRVIDCGSTVSRPGARLAPRPSHLRSGTCRCAPAWRQLAAGIVQVRQGVAGRVSSPGSEILKSGAQPAWRDAVASAPA